MPAASGDGTAATSPSHRASRLEFRPRCQRRTTTCRRVPICRQRTPRTELMASFLNLCVSHQTATQAMKAPSRPGAAMSARADMSASALRRSTELRGQRATRGMPAVWHRTCVGNERTAVHARRMDTTARRRKLDAHEGTAGRAFHAGMRNHSASCSASAPTPGWLSSCRSPGVTSQAIFVGAQPTQWHDGAGRTATSQRRSSHREESGVRALHLAAAWRRWHGRCAVWRRRRRRIGWHGAPGVAVELLHADQPRRRRGRGGCTGRSAPRQRLGSGRRALHAVVGGRTT